MTSLSVANIKCSCGKANRFIYHTSINTRFDSDQIDKLLAGQLNLFKCKNCQQLIHLPHKVLINSSGGMFWISPADDLENIKNTLKDHGLISENGRPKVPFYEKLTDKDLNEFINEKNLNQSDKAKLRDYIEKKKKRDLFWSRF